jgi:hypothetical protein
MNDAPARLVVLRGLSPNEEFALIQAKTVIGRGPMNEIVLTDPEISRRHAQIIRQGENYAIEDLGSTNGTFVNQLRVTALTPLNHGDNIDFGESVTLTFLATTADSAPAFPTYDEYDEFAGDTLMEPYSEMPPLPAAVADRRVVEPDDFAFPQPARGRESPNRRRWLISCGCATLTIVFLCAALLFFLDAYDQGRLLYCGGLRPFFELLLGPFGFSPACAPNSTLIPLLPSPFLLPPSAFLLPPSAFLLPPSAF